MLIDMAVFAHPPWVMDRHPHQIKSYMLTISDLIAAFSMPEHGLVLELGLKIN